MTAATVGLCLDCNYPLDGLPTPRCPECGREFDPDDRDSFNPGRPIPRWASWAMGPISWPVDLGVLAGVVITLWRARLPGENFSFKSAFLWGWVAVAALWLLWPVLRRGVLLRYGWPRRIIKPMHRGHWVIPLLIMLLVTMLDLQLPRRIAFRRSEHAMNALARDVMAHPHEQHDNTTVGLYAAKRIRALPGGMRFTSQDDDVQFKAGFEYMPSLNPHNTSFHGYHYLGDGWWAWREEG